MNMVSYVSTFVGAFIWDGLDLFGRGLHFLLGVCIFWEMLHLFGIGCIYLEGG